jgi:hypothetical protein
MYVSMNGNNLAMSLFSIRKRLFGEFLKMLRLLLAKAMNAASSSVTTDEDVSTVEAENDGTTLACANVVVE